MSPKEVLSKAADVLEKNGWCRFAYHDRPSDTYCVVGAIESVCGPGMDAREAKNRLKDFLLLNRECQSLEGWNDAEGMTTDIVLAALRGAAK